MAGTKFEPDDGHTIVEVSKQELIKRFNTGPIPVTGEIAAGDDKDLDITGFVQKANIKQIRAFGEGNDPSDFDIELFSKATSDGSPCSDQYRQYQWQNIDTQDVDGADVPIIIEDQEPVTAGVTLPTAEELHIRITNNTADTMHVTDVEIIFEELLS